MSATTFQPRSADAHFGVPSAKVAVQNINHPGNHRPVDASMYQAMRQAILTSLPNRAPGITLAQLLESVLPQLPQQLYPQGAKAGWWLKTVQLDLEAKALIQRDSASPLRLMRTS